MFLIKNKNEDYEYYDFPLFLWIIILYFFWNEDVCLQNIEIIKISQMPMRTDSLKISPRLEQERYQAKLWPEKLFDVSQNKRRNIHWTTDTEVRRTNPNPDPVL